jgi:hypothetical protein
MEREANSLSIKDLIGQNLGISVKRDQLGDITIVRKADKFITRYSLGIDNGGSVLLFVTKRKNEETTPLFSGTFNLTSSETIEDTHLQILRSGLSIFDALLQTTNLEDIQNATEDGIIDKVNCPTTSEDVMAQSAERERLNIANLSDKYDIFKSTISNL